MTEQLFTLRDALKRAVDVAVGHFGSNFDLAGVTFTFTRVLGHGGPHEIHKHVTASMSLEPLASESKVGAIWRAPAVGYAQLETLFSDPTTGKTFVEETK